MHSSFCDNAQLQPGIGHWDRTYEVVILLHERQEQTGDAAALSHFHRARLIESLALLSSDEGCPLIGLFVLQ